MKNKQEVELQKLSDAINNYFYRFNDDEAVLLPTKYKIIKMCNNYNTHNKNIVFSHNGYSISDNVMWIGENRDKLNIHCGTFYPIYKFIENYSTLTPKPHTIDPNEFINSIDNLDELDKLKAIIDTRENNIKLQKEEERFLSGDYISIGNGIDIKISSFVDRKIKIRIEELNHCTSIGGNTIKKLNKYFNLLEQRT